MKTIPLSRAPALPARDFFAWRRAHAGVPDRPPRTACGLLCPEAYAAAADAAGGSFGREGVPLICGLPECEPCGKASAVYWFGTDAQVSL